jgi:hypothetical protein
VSLMQPPFIKSNQIFIFFLNIVAEQFGDNTFLN